MYHQELFSIFLEKLTGTKRAGKLISNFRVELKRNGPDVSGWDEPGSYSGKGVSKIGSDAVMWLTTLNTTSLKSPDALPSEHTHTHTRVHIVCGCGRRQKHLGVSLLIKIILSVRLLSRLTCSDL